MSNFSKLTKEEYLSIALEVEKMLLLKIHTEITLVNSATIIKPHKGSNMPMKFSLARYDLFFEISEDSKNLFIYINEDKVDQHNTPFTIIFNIAHEMRHIYQHVNLANPKFKKMIQDFKMCDELDGDVDKYNMQDLEIDAFRFAYDYLLGNFDLEPQFIERECLQGIGIDVINRIEKESWCSENGTPIN